MNKCKVLFWDDCDEDSPLMEALLSPRATEILKDMLEAGLESYEDDDENKDDPALDAIRFMINNL